EAQHARVVDAQFHDRSGSSVSAARPMPRRGETPRLPPLSRPMPTLPLASGQPSAPSWQHTTAHENRKIWATGRVDDAGQGIARGYAPTSTASHADRGRRSPIDVSGCPNTS